MAKKKIGTPVVDPRNKLIAKRMVELRKQAGFSSQEDFANEFGIGRMSCWRAESGKTNITMKLLFQILDAHSLSLAEFFAPLNDVNKK